MLLTERSNNLEVKGVAKCVGEHNGAGFGPDGLLNQASINVVGAKFNINKHRYCTELQNGVNSGREACRYGNDLIALLNSTVA